MKHEFRVITKQEIEQTRAKAYKYINFYTMEYTPIKTETIIKNRKYAAHFTVSNNGLSFETTIAGNSYQECLTKTAKFLKIDINSLILAKKQHETTTNTIIPNHTDKL